MEANKIFNNNSNVYLQGPKFQSNVVLFEKPKFICLNGAVKQMHGISFIFEEKEDYSGKKRYNTVRIPLIGELLEPGASLESYNSLLLPEEKIMTPDTFKKCLSDAEKMYEISYLLEELKEYGFTVEVTEEFLTIKIYIHDEVVVFSSPYLSLSMNAKDNGTYVSPVEFIDIIRIAVYLNKQLNFVSMNGTDKENALVKELERMKQACLEYGFMDSNVCNDDVYNDGTYSYTNNLGKIRMSREEFLAKFPDAYKLSID